MTPRTLKPFPSLLTHLKGHTGERSQNHTSNVKLWPIEILRATSSQPARLCSVVANALGLVSI